MLKRRGRKPKVSVPKDKFKNIPINFTHRQVQELDELSQQRQETRSELVRDAVRFYTEHLNMAEEDARQSELSREVARIEKRLSSLMVKLLRVTGQNLYWSSLLWLDGPPKARLNQEGFNNHWEKSTAFSAAILRARKSNELGEEVTQESPKLLENG